MVRICHVIPFYDEQYGGSERYVQMLSRHQIESGFDVTIITTTRSRRRTGISKQNGVEVIKCYSITDVWNINPVSIVSHQLTSESFDVLHIHSYLYFTSNQAAFVGKLKKIPTLLHLHGGIGQPPYKASLLKRTAKSFYDKTLGFQTFSLSDMVASVSKNDINTLSSHRLFNYQNIEYIPNAVNTQLFGKERKVSSLSKTEFRIIFIGDIEPWKGLGIIEKWIRSGRLNPKREIHFDFIGQGSYVPRLLRLCKEIDNPNIKIKYLGQISHERIPSYLNKSDVLLLPSYWEGVPTVILEAMASRTPVIATSVGDIPNIIENGKNGFLINHNINTLSNLIDTLIENPKELDLIGKEAYKTIINSFSSERIHKIVKKAYFKLLNKNGITF